MLALSNSCCLTHSLWVTYSDLPVSCRAASVKIFVRGKGCSVSD